MDCGDGCTTLHKTDKITSIPSSGPIYHPQPNIFDRRS